MAEISTHEIGAMEKISDTKDSGIGLAGSLHQYFFDT
jgi:hypothetical protein